MPCRWNNWIWAGDQCVAGNPAQPASSLHRRQQAARLLQLLQSLHNGLCSCCAVLYIVVLCCARYETNLLNTAGQAMDLLSDVNHDNAYVHLVSSPCSLPRVLQHVSWHGIYTLWALVRHLRYEGGAHHPVWPLPYAVLSVLSHATLRLSVST